MREHLNEFIRRGKEIKEVVRDIAAMRVNKMCAYLFRGCCNDSNYREYFARIICNPSKPIVCKKQREKEREGGEGGRRGEQSATNTSTELKTRRMTITSGKQVVAANNEDVYDVYKQGINFLTRSCSWARRIKCFILNNDMIFLTY